MKTFSMTDVGKRRESNQDYVYMSESPIGNLPNLFIVADGMGGHNAGDFASKYTVEQIVDHVSNSSQTTPVEIIREAIEAANTALIEKARTDQTLSGMGTTIVLAVIIDHSLYVANVGDSRLYLLHDKIEQITKDHSLVQEMVRMGEMNEAEAREHPDKNIITRAIGAADEVEIDFFEQQIQAGDTILLCTDGLTNMIDDSDIFTIICTQRDIVEKAQRLVETANRNGGKDNITVAIIEPYSDEVKIC